VHEGLADDEEKLVEFGLGLEEVRERLELLLGGVGTAGSAYLIITHSHFYQLYQVD
jgi:hypothetical protein